MSQPPSQAAVAFAKAFVADMQKMPPPMTIGHEEALVAMLFDRHIPATDRAGWQGIGTQWHVWVHPDLGVSNRLPTYSNPNAITHWTDAGWRAATLVEMPAPPSAPSPTKV